MDNIELCYALMNQKNLHLYIDSVAWFDILLSRDEYTKEMMLRNYVNNVRKSYRPSPSE
jgi:hypothetical protein